MEQEKFTQMIVKNLPTETNEYSILKLFALMEMLNYDNKKQFFIPIKKMVKQDFETNLMEIIVDNLIKHTLNETQH